MAIGRLSSGEFCVAWRELPPSSAGYRIELAYRDTNETYAFDAPPASAGYLAIAGPASPGSSMNGRCFLRENFDVLLYARQAEAEILAGGVTVVGSCNVRWVSASGCHGPLGKGDIAISPVVVAGTMRLCVAWEDRHNDELGFRVVFERPRANERYEFEVGPDVVELILPEAASLTAEPGTQEWIFRKDYGVQIFVILSTGEEPVGATFVQIM